MNTRRRKYVAAILTFIFVFGIFTLSALAEYRRAVAAQERQLTTEVTVLKTHIDSVINRSIRNTLGIISYVQVRPDLTQEELEAYSVQLIPKDDVVTRHFALIEDTTITMAYPLKENASAIGVDLAQLDAQREDILRVKEKGESILIGPVDLVQGGRALINRSPIYLNPGTDQQTYFGQLALVIRYDPFMKESGIVDFARTHLVKIEQLGPTQEVVSVLYTNTEAFGDDSIESVIEIPNGKWLITVEYPDGFTGVSNLFYLLLVMGLAFGVLAAAFTFNLLRSNADLNAIVEERTHKMKEANDQLALSLEELQATQDQMIMREKLAALGELVASVAHEINTPLGICVTIGSYIQQQITELEKKFSTNSLKRSDLNKGFDEMKESLSVLVNNLNRSSELVSSFKQVATDQHLNEIRSINVGRYLEDVLNSVRPKFKGTSHTLELHVAPNLWVTTAPGALSQIVTNLVVNSLLHGFNKMEDGRVEIYVKKVEKELILDYYDNGSGIPEDNRDKIFTPFFTTRKHSGSTGLGMHIVYNIVVHSLKGTIELKDKEAQGVHFHFVLPAYLHTDE